jgi:hypothetical protein
LHLVGHLYYSSCYILHVEMRQNVIILLPNLQTNATITRIL